MYRIEVQEELQAGGSTLYRIKLCYDELVLLEITARNRAELELLKAQMRATYPIAN